MHAHRRPNVRYPVHICWSESFLCVCAVPLNRECLFLITLHRNQHFIRSVTTFRDSLSVPSSRVKRSKNCSFLSREVSHLKWRIESQRSAGYAATFRRCSAVCLLLRMYFISNELPATALLHVFVMILHVRRDVKLNCTYRGDVMGSRLGQLPQLVSPALSYYAFCWDITIGVCWKWNSFQSTALVTHCARLRFDNLVITHYT